MGKPKLIGSKITKKQSEGLAKNCVVDKNGYMLLPPKKTKEN